MLCIPSRLGPACPREMGPCTTKWDCSVFYQKLVIGVGAEADRFICSFLPPVQFAEGQELVWAWARVLPSMGTGQSWLPIPSIKDPPSSIASPVSPLLP